MKNKLILLIGIVLLMTMISNVRASEINVPVSITINGGVLEIIGDNLDFSYNLSSFYNLTTNQTTNKSYNTLQIIKLQGENAESLESLLRDMTVQCNESMALWGPYTNCSLTTQVLNQTQDALGICLLDKSTCTNRLNYWTTSAAPFAITNPGEIKPKFDSAKNSLVWLVVVAALVAGFGVYYWTSKKGKGKRPSDLQTADYD